MNQPPDRIKLLQESPLLPAWLLSADALQTMNLVGVFAGDVAVALCGPAGDTRSERQAAILAADAQFGRQVSSRGYNGPLTFGHVAGERINWPEKAASLIRKTAGQSPRETDRGPAVTIFPVRGGHDFALSVACDLPLARKLSDAKHARAKLAQG